MRAPLGDFLRRRREQLTPDDVGLSSDSSRRVPGLRRSEVAERAGISADYYLRLEQGRQRQPSLQVLQSLARALQLDADSLRYMQRLVELTEGVRPLPAMRPGIVESVRQVMEMWDHTPAFVTDSNVDVVAANRLARAVGGEALRPGANLVEMTFSEAGRTMIAGWEDRARESVAQLRFRSDPYDPRLHEIVGTLSMRDADFRRIWARHEARPLVMGGSTLSDSEHEPFQLNFQNFEVQGAPGCVLTVLHAPPHSPGAAVLQELVATDG